MNRRSSVLGTVAPFLLLLTASTAASTDEFRIYLGRDALGSEFFAEARSVRKNEPDTVVFRMKKIPSALAVQRSVAIQPTTAAKMTVADIAYEIAAVETDCLYRKYRILGYTSHAANGVELAENRTPYAWMSVSPGDNDDTVFVSNPCRLFRNK